MTPTDFGGLTAASRALPPLQLQPTETAAIARRPEPQDDSDEDKKLLDEALERFQLVCQYEANWRRQAEREMAFVYALDHWSAEQLKERQGRPCLVFDQISPAIDNVVNDARQSPPEPRISPVGGGADKDTAEVLQGLIRNIDNDSRADIAFLTGYEYAVAVGRGWWRVIYQYENDDDFQQKIIVKRVPNLFAVYPDPATDEFDYSDMRYCFVTEDLDETIFKEMYPTAKASSGDFTGVGDNVKHDWFPKGSVRVAEYWWVKTIEEHIAQLADGSIVPWDQVPEGVIPRNVRRVDRRKISWAKLCGNEILERGDHPGKWIPIIPCLGKEIIKDRRRELRGMIRSAMDANLSYDYTRSKQVEAVALTPLAPWLAEEGSIDGYEHLYADANRKSINVLPWKGRRLDDSPYSPPSRITVEPDIAALTTCVQYAKQDIDSQLVTYPASLGAPGPESSGRAILARQREGDNAHFNYHDNLARSIRHTGRIILDLIPHVYSEERVVTIVDPDGKSRAVPINQEHMVKGIAKIFDVRNPVARYDVTISSGPSYATRRQQGVDAFLQLVQSAPEAMTRALDLGIKMMDIPNADQIAMRLRPPDVQSDDDEQTPLPPQVQAQLQQQGQMIQALSQQVHSLLDIQEKQILKLESEERRTAMTAKASIIAADIKAKADEAKIMADIETSGINKRLDVLHQAVSLELEAQQMEADRQQQEQQQQQQQQANSQPTGGGG